MVVTNKFPDGNFSRPRLDIFAFASQNKNMSAASTCNQKSRADGFFVVVVSLYHLLELFLSENVSFRHCLAEPRQPRKKNTPCFLDLVGVKFLLKKERVFFFRGSALQVFGQVAEHCGRSFGKTIFWGNDLPKLRLIDF